MSTKYIKYTCVNTEPLSITDLYNSKSDEAAVLSYITGSSVRGFVMNTMAATNKSVFEKYKHAFFDGTLRFLNAYPAIKILEGSKKLNELATSNKSNELNGSFVQETIPVPKGFYEDRKADSHIIHVFSDDDGTKLTGKKRAKAGKFAAFTSSNTDSLFFMSPVMGETFKIRLARNGQIYEEISDEKTAKQQLFRGDYLEKGHIFHGYIAFSDQTTKNEYTGELIKTVKNILTTPGMKLGSNRSSGYGSVKITLASDSPVNWIPFSSLSIANDQSEKAVLKQNFSSETPYSGTDISRNISPGDNPICIDMLCLSNLCMLNEYGEPCGINENELADIFQCSELKIEKASSSVTHICNFNRITGGRSPEYPVYEAGSIFRLKCSSTPSAEVLRKVEENGLGILTREGLGRVIFIKNIETISQKIKCKPALELPEQEDYIPEQDLKNMTRLCALSILQKRLEQSITQYVLEHPFEKGSASKSQRGNISALCKSLRYRPEDAPNTFKNYFEHIEEKENTTKTHRTWAGSQMTLKDSVMTILETDLFQLLGHQNDTVCDLKTTDLMDSKRQLLYKLQLIEELIHYANRKEKANV